MSGDDIGMYIGMAVFAFILVRYTLSIIDDKKEGILLKADVVACGFSWGILAVWLFMLGWGLWS